MTLTVFLNDIKPKIKPDLDGVNCQLSHFYGLNAMRHTAHIFADTIPRLVTITTTAVGMVKIFCYFSFVIISLPATPQLYYLLYRLH